MSNLTIRSADELRAQISALVERLGMPSQGSITPLLRNLVAQAHDRWHLAPYFSKRNRCVALVLADGTMLYWLVEQLYLVEARRKLPCESVMKPEKKDYYEDQAKKAGVSLSQHLERIRLLSYFSVWDGFDVGDGEIRAQAYDHSGLMIGFADLDVDLPQDTTIVRETLVANADYAQHRVSTPSEQPDRVDIPINLPTLALDVFVLVDLELYGEERKIKKDAALDFELRNCDLAKIPSTRLASAGSPISFDKSRYSYERRDGALPHEETRESVIENVNRLLARTDEVCAQMEPRAGQGASQRESHRLQCISIPDSYLFGHLAWQHPYENFVASLSWNKPS